MKVAKSIEDEIFFAAFEIADLDRRKLFLDQACAGNLELRTAVEDMLASQDDANQLFRRGTGAIVSTVAHLDDADSLLDNSELKPADEQIGARIGCYKILERIGEGGCGVVYLAEQEFPIRRRVALKVTKPGMDTERVIARFEAERQALALMEHPNIARALDAGATTTGRPYFVMELVRGVKLTEYCDQHNLDTRQRLDLFILICQAVQHAHQKGVIHRDIKPSNILVTLQDGIPSPKVIDFGIAKAIEGKLIEQTFFTTTEQLVGTPAYMSPEQAEMSASGVDTRTDIYSLGVLLYELLTGRTPFDSKQLIQSGLDQMRRTLRETEPQLPSKILTTLQNADLQAIAFHRHAHPPRLISAIKGDLDWIVMKAMEKDRSRRYETVNGLMRDIERYLKNEPVTARPPSRWYLFQKSVRRNQLAYTAAGAIAFILIFSLGVLFWMFQNERVLHHRAEAAEQEQARLRAVAERGLATEAKLRQQSEGREKINKAAALIERGNYTDADALIAQLPMDQADMEGASVFRELGKWNVKQQRWSAAKDCFLLMENATQADDRSYTSLDSTCTAVTIIECGANEEYRRFCENTIKRFGDTSDPIVAERAVKNCLLVPGSEALIQQLKPLAQLARRSLEGTDFSAKDLSWQITWRCLTLALWEYRVGDYSEAALWARRCLDSGGPELSRQASARVILAMALYRLGDADSARSELAQSRILIEAKSKGSLETEHSEDGFWFDWVLGRIFLGEATALVGKQSGA